MLKQKKRANIWITQPCNDTLAFFFIYLQIEKQVAGVLNPH